ncbi:MULTISPECIES: TonB-dependent receptor [unclassified Brevundimonas]|uniref:TonB-dependent receptor n=1 Tax=unclassified Brevundimonas TaxID=2622653 RepID=UPI00289CC38E|nr:TonB-dependent receptor [Brevundimonas sp.]
MLFDLPIPPQSPQDEAVQVSDVVVTAARLPPAASEAAFSVVRLGQSEIAASVRADEALRAIPAVSLFRRTTSLSANPTTQGLSLRAIAPSGAGRALVTLDGVPLNDPFGGWVIWAQSAPESLSGIDVIRGAGAGPYGAGTLTGVVALREKDADGGVLDISIAERGGLRASGTASVGNERFALTVSGLHETSDGYVPVRGTQAGRADVPMDLTAEALSGRLDVNVTDNIRLSVRAATWEEDRGSGLGNNRANASGNSLSATLARAPANGRSGWRLQAWQNHSNLFNSSGAVSADRNAVTPANEQYRTPARGRGANVALRRQDDVLSGRLEWEIGADARFFEGETQERFRFMNGVFTRGRKAGGEASVAGLYLDGSWDKGPWLLAGGIRVDQWTNNAGFRFEDDLQNGSVTLDETEDKRSDTVFSARLAARRALGQGWSLRGAAYSGFRPASLNELHRPFRVGNDLTEANAALSPETLKGVEAGLGFANDRIEANASLFWNRIEDAIVNVTLAQGPGTFPRAGFVPAGGVLRQRQNAGTIDATGIELSLKARLAEGLDARGAVSWTDAEMDGDDSAPQLTGLRPAQAPRWSAVLGLDWQAAERLHLGVDGRYESDRFDDDLNSRVLKAAWTLDARAAWQALDHAALWVAVDNLMDEDVQTSQTATGIAGYTAPRTWRAGVRLTY